MSGQLLQEDDKKRHFFAGAFISATTYTFVYYKTKDKKKALLYSLGTSLLVGCIKESIDGTQSGNRFDSRDLLASTYGSVSIIIPLTIFSKKNR